MLLVLVLVLVLLPLLLLLVVVMGYCHEPSQVTSTSLTARA